jgi:hypothetical protein
MGWKTYPCNERSHYFFFILKPHCTLQFDSILGYHNTHKVNQFVKCVTLKWFYPKGIPHNSNEWVVIGIRPIVCVPMPKHNGTWECEYLVVECFNQYMDKCGDKEHCPGVEVGFATCCHHFFIVISNML